MNINMNVDHDVLEALRARIEGFDETPYGVLRRILGLPPTPGRSTSSSAPAAKRAATKKRAKPRSTNRQRNRAGNHLGSEHFVVPLLRAMADNTDGVSRAEALQVAGELVGPLMTDADRAPQRGTNQRYPQWHKTVDNTRTLMVRQGLLEMDADRKRWCITDAGRERLAAESGDTRSTSNAVEVFGPVDTHSASTPTYPATNSSSATPTSL